MRPGNKKRKTAPPDELFERGPLRVARFGKNVVLQSNWPEGVFAEMQRQAVEDLPTVVRTIDALVHEIASLVSLLPPEQLLLRAWWELAHRHLTIRAEADLSWEDGVAVRMVDYIQSVVAAVPPALSPQLETTEADWQTLRTKVDELFRKVNLDYQICLSAKHKADDADLDPHFEEFRFKAQGYWCNVRGSRYQIHYPPYLSDVFLPHSAVLDELFGLTGEQFIAEITKLWHTLTFGLRDTIEQFDRFQTDTLNAIRAKLVTQASPLQSDPPALLAEAIRENAWEHRQTDLLGRLFGTDLFDVQKVTRLPQSLVDQLAWRPGEDKDFFAEGDFSGWPLRTWPTSKRPFIQLNGRYYCFDLYSLFDNLYRVMQRLIMRLKPEYQETWNRTQQSLSEELPFKYLRRLLPGASEYRNVYYRGETDSGHAGWCEADGLFVYDDHLFIIESRGGAFTHTSPATDFSAYVASLRNLVLKPSTQGISC